MDVSGREPTDSDEISSGLLCDPCKGAKEHEHAEFYCTICNEYLCQVCGRSHQRSKVSKGHPLLGLDSMPREKLSSEDTVCPKHSDRPIEYLCKVHNKGCCTVCVTVEHKQCKVEYIDDIAAGFETSQEYTSLVNTIGNLIRLLQKTRDKSIENICVAHNTHAAFISDVEKFRSEINSILDSLEQSSLIESQIRRDSSIETFDSITTECERMKADIKKMSSTMEKYEKYKVHRQLVIFSKKASVQVKEFDKRVNELSNQNNISVYKFNPNERISHVLDSINSLGRTVQNKCIPMHKPQKFVLAGFPKDRYEFN